MSANNECSICLEDISDKAQVDGCSHVFCMPCITLWSKNSNTCPMCKATISEISRFGARTLSTVKSNGRVTRSKVDKNATIEVQRRVQERDFDFDELLRLGIPEEEIAAQVDELSSDNEDAYDTQDGWCVSDESSSSSSSSSDSSNAAVRRKRTRRTSPRIANPIDLTNDDDDESSEIQVTVTRQSKRRRDG